MILRRWAATGCYLGLWAWGLNCPGAGLKGGPGLVGRPGNALPGVSSLLPPGLGKKVAGIAAHSSGTKAGALAGNKGTTTVAPGVNAFLPATTPGTGVASDGSLGNGAVTYSNSTYTIPASVGAQVGGNLFESFNLFNLIQGETADFQGPSSVQNILARVTGGSASSINGTIESGIQGASLFLINHAGVMFGPNASLNVSGAFTVSTADYAKLADGGKFNASLTANDTSLTSGAVSAFGFLSSTPAPVSFTGSQLSVSAGTGLNVIAGNVTLDSPTSDTSTPGATLSAPSGGLTVFSAASAGEAPFSLTAPGAGYGAASFGALGSLSLSNGSTMAIDGAGEGELVLRAGAMTLDNSVISSINTGSILGGDINVQVAKALNLSDGAQIAGGAQGSGKSGNVSVQAGSLEIDGDAVQNDLTGILDQSDAGATGAAGNLTVNVAGKITIFGTGVISASTFSSGNAGDLTVKAGSMTIEGQVALITVSTGIFDESDQGNAGDSGGNGGSLRIVVRGALTLEGDDIDTDTYTAGNGGKLTVNAGSLIMLGAPQNVTNISSDTYAAGNAGDVTVSAGSILIDGLSYPNTTTYISAEVEQSTTGPSATGAGGKVTVNAGTLVIRGSGEIDTDTSDNKKAGDLTVNAGSLSIIGNDPDSESFISSDTNSAGGNAGNVTISAESILIDGEGYDTNAYISADVVEGATGAGGKVTINAGSLVVRGSGEIDTDTYDSEKAGDLTVRAGSLSIYGDPNYPTYISSDSYAGGNAGDVTVVAGSILIDGEGHATFTAIAAESAPGATGNGGNVTIGAGTLVIDGGGKVDAATYSTGKSGDVAVTAQNITISGFSNVPSGIFASSALEAKAGAAGGISIQCGNLTLEDGGAIAASAVAASAGDITINVRQNVTIEDQGAISSSAGVSGGNITVNAGGLVYLLDSSITATAGSSSVNGKQINPNAGNGGNITIDPQFIVLDDSLISANAAIGQGGNIILESSYYLDSGSMITATGATSGMIIITSPELNLSGALVGLPSRLVGEESQLQETCVMALNGDFSSFLAVGQGDVEAAPDETQGATGDAGEHPREQASPAIGNRFTGMGSDSEVVSPRYNPIRP